MFRIVVSAFAIALWSMPVSAATSWVQLFTDSGTGTNWRELYEHWGTDGKHTIENTPEGLHVAGGGTSGQSDQMVLLWIGAQLPTADFVLQYSVRRNDTTANTGTATMMILSAKGIGSVSSDPAATKVAVPSLSFVEDNLHALRLSTMPAYNKNPKLNAQVRLRHMPGNTQIGAGSPNHFPFTPGVWNAVKITKLGSKVTISIAPVGGVKKSYSWTSAVIPTRNGPRVGFYLQGGRDITIKNLKLMKRG
jgi:hypothetical protein